MQRPPSTRQQYDTAHGKNRRMKLHSTRVDKTNRMSAHEPAGSFYFIHISSRGVEMTAFDAIITPTKKGRCHAYAPAIDITAPVELLSAHTARPQALPPHTCQQSDDTWCRSPRSCGLKRTADLEPFGSGQYSTV